jgi:hypothetical protein
MFWGKLWVRIRGELLTLRDDLLGEGELGQRSREFLEKIERSLDGPDFKVNADGDVADRLDAVNRRLDELERSLDASKRSYESPDRKADNSAEALEKALEELRRSRKTKKDQSAGSKAPPPNPRTLG